MPRLFVALSLPAGLREEVSGLTGGILYVLHVGPYMELTFAGIYEEIRQIALEEGKVSQLELDGAAN